MTLDTRDDRTLFFDLLPIFFRTSGFSFRIKVYTVPGQPVHEATRKVVLAGADGVVFVADSSPISAQANRASWQNLIANLDDARARARSRSSSSTTSATCRTRCRSTRSIGSAIRAARSCEACAKRGDGVVADVLRAGRPRLGRPRSAISSCREQARDRQRRRSGRRSAEHVGVSGNLDRIPAVSASGPLDDPIELARLVPPGELDELVDRDRPRARRRRSRSTTRPGCRLAGPDAAGAPHRAGRRTTAS